MRYETKRKRALRFAGGFALSVLAGVVPVRAEQGLIEALTQGKPDLYLRYRFEHVDDGTPGIKDAYANTLRTALGYNTGTFHEFGLYLQLEDVRVIGDEDFNDGSNRKPDRALVVDPEGTEIKQANLRFEGVPKTVLRLGRQEITDREAPLHRWIGNVLWRQHWQMFDAFRILNLSFPNTVVDYAYVWNVNRIFGERNPLPDRSDFRMDSHVFNLQYTGFSLGTLEAYSYLLDFKSRTSDRFSTQTYGLRFQGAYDVVSKLKLLYSGEFANQTDYENNPNKIDVNYYMAELGLSYAIDQLLQSVTVKGSYEVLEGKGGVDALQTPLGTNHAFQGWADRFLVTPGDGIKDLYVTFSTKLFGAQFMVAYHELCSDKDDYRYGTEWDLLLEKPFAKHFLVGLKYAEYDADQNTLNLQRNGVRHDQQAFDLTKFWAYVQFSF